MSRTLMLSTTVNSSSWYKVQRLFYAKVFFTDFWHLNNEYCSYCTFHLHSLHLHLPTRHLNHHLQHQLNQDCHFPLLMGSRQTPHHETCQFHRAAACHSRADSCSSHYRTVEKRKKNKAETILAWRKTKKCHKP